MLMRARLLVESLDRPIADRSGHRRRTGRLRRAVDRRKAARRRVARTRPPHRAPRSRRRHASHGRGEGRATDGILRAPEAGSDLRLASLSPSPGPERRGRRRPRARHWRVVCDLQRRARGAAAAARLRGRRSPGRRPAQRAKPGGACAIFSTGSRTTACSPRWARRRTWTPNLGGVGDPEKLFALRVTSEILPMLGVPPALGRFPDAGEAGLRRS